MTIKETFVQYIKETGVRPPFTRKKVEKKGYEVGAFLLELKSRLEKADDLVIHAQALKDYFKACDRLVVEE